jgi:hypothetical protein
VLPQFPNGLMSELESCALPTFLENARWNAAGTRRVWSDMSQMEDSPAAGLGTGEWALPNPAFPPSEVASEINMSKRLPASLSADRQMRRRLDSWAERQARRRRR